jgi:hypothetical protein
MPRKPFGQRLNDALARDTTLSEADAFRLAESAVYAQGLDDLPPDDRSLAKRLLNQTPGQARRGRRSQARQSGTRKRQP